MLAVATSPINKEHTGLSTETAGVALGPCLMWPKEKAKDQTEAHQQKLMQAVFVATLVDAMISRTLPWPALVFSEKRGVIKLPPAPVATSPQN